MFKCEYVAGPNFVGVKHYPVCSYFIDDLPILAEKMRNFQSVAQTKAVATLQNLTS